MQVPLARECGGAIVGFVSRFPPPCGSSMGVIQIPRVVTAIARGYWQRRTPVDKLVGISAPHVLDRRCGLWDVDVYGHMNNAAYLVHFEMARWNMAAQNGLLDWCVRERSAFIIGGLSLRFRKEIGPFQPFEVCCSARHSRALGMHMQRP
jgi:hypothetical protein